MHISASQINGFLMCQRIWGWRYLDRLPGADSRATALGSECHSDVDRYLKSGKLPDASRVWSYEDKDYYPGKIAIELIYGLNRIINIDYLWKYNAQFELKFNVTPYQVKKYYNLDLPADVNLTGIFDVAWVYDGVNIVDHKTSSDPAKWGKKADDLEDDTQSILYKFCAPIAFNSKGAGARFWLNYASTKYKKSGSYSVGGQLCEYDKIKNDFEEKLLPVIKLMAEIKRNNLKALDLPPDPHSCDLFLGCGLKSVCNLTNAERIVGYMSNGNSVLDRMRAAAASQKQGKVVDDQKMPEEQPEAETKKGSLMDRIKASQSVNPPESASEEPQTPETAKKEADALEKETSGRRGRPKGSTKKGRAVKPQPSSSVSSDATDEADYSGDSEVSAALGFLTGVASTTACDQDLINKAANVIREAIR